MRLKLTAAVTICAILLAGCRVGPKYTTPAAPVPPAYKESAPANYQTAPPGTWRPAQPRDSAIKGKWWEMFHEPELNALEEQLNVNNQTIVQNFQNFMAARAMVAEARAAYFPTVGITASATRTHVGGGSAGASGGTIVTNNGGTTRAASTSGGSSTFNFFSVPLDVSWAPDLFGRVRNTVREFRYAAQVSAADLENIRLVEQADLAVFFFELRGQDSLIDLQNRTIRAFREALDLARARVETGIDNPEAVAQAEVTLRSAEAAGTGLGVSRAIFEHAIATLIGRPASVFEMPVKQLTTPVPSIPLGVPSELLERRPDIAAAERTMAQANAAIGVAKAAYYPTVNLTGTTGFQSSMLSTLFSAPSFFWSIGASAAQTIFEGGLRRATVEQFTATYNADVALYRQTVLTAFQQVEDGLATLRVVSGEIGQQAEAIGAGQRNLEIALARYETGLDPYLNVVTAQTALLTSQETYATLRVTEMTAAVQLIQALGGGWSVTDLPSASEVTSKSTVKKLSGEK
jgi:NodT family efflux transporter outer membrane factor (OMF) lipoprotein